MDERDLVRSMRGGTEAAFTAFFDAYYPRLYRWAAHEGGWQIHFADDALRQSSSTIVLHGSITGLTPEQALDTILPTCGLTHRIEQDVVNIRAASRDGK